MLAYRDAAHAVLGVEGQPVLAWLDAACAGMGGDRW